MKTMRLVSEIVFIVALIGVVAEPGQAQFDGCGDFNLDGNVTMTDLNLLFNYLFDGGPAPDSLDLMNVDGRPGITITDFSFLASCYLVDWQWHEGCNLCRDTIAYDLSAEDIVYVRNETVPPGTGQHVAEIWFQPARWLKGLSFPFSFSCTTSAVAIDSIVFHTLTGPGLAYAQEYKIDSMNQTALVAMMLMQSSVTTKSRLASIHFSLFPKPFEQTIVIDTTTLPDTQTYAAHVFHEDSPFNGEVVRPTLYGTPTTEPHPPSCCVGETGDVSMDGNVTLTDLAQVINMLFVTFEPVACYPEANMYGDDKCYLNLSDVSNLVNKLFITFQPVDYCDQFDNFICGQFY